MCAGQLRRTARFVSTVNAPQSLEMIIVEALDAKRNAIDPGSAKTGEFGCLDRPWISFQRNFRLGRQHGEGAESRYQFIDCRR